MVQKKITERSIELILLLVLFLLIVLPRLWVVSTTVTIDEDKWLIRSANFRYALQTKNWPETYQKEHPGVTVMWAGTLGLSFLLRNNQEVLLDQSSQPELSLVLQANSNDLLDGLIAARVVMILFNSLVLSAVFVYARCLLGTLAAVIGVLLIAFSPFYAAHTHLLHLDGLVGTLMLLSVLAFVQYFNGFRWYNLVISGIAAGMAWLTKAQGFLLIPILVAITILFRVAIYRRDNDTWIYIFRDIFFILGTWILTALVSFVILWPAMWVSPVATLQRMFSAIVDDSSLGHNSPIFFHGEIFQVGEQIPSNSYYYPRSYLWRSTPVTLIGLILTMIALISGKLHTHPAQRNTIVALFIAVVITFIWLEMGNKKFDRYLLPAFGPLALLAAIGWAAFGTWLHNHRYFSPRFRLDLVALIIMIAIQIGFLIQSYPYFLSFYNPLLGGSAKAPGVMMIGWGEGLDAAAEYLNAKPDAASLLVASWYRPSLAYFFRGKTIDIPSSLTSEQEAKILAADYIVIYIHQWQRNLPPTLLAKLDKQSPEHIIRDNGIEYARIYKHLE